MKAVTDSGPTAPGQEMSQPVKNLFTLMSVVSDESTVTHFREKYAACEIRYGDMKKQLGEDIARFTDPIRQRIHEIYSDNAYLAKVVAEGAEKARANAAATVKDVREIIGYRKFI